MTDYHAIRWNGKTATRKTREVNLSCQILDGGKRIMLDGTADCEHHLVEDSAILLKKMAETICGEGH